MAQDNKELSLEEIRDFIIKEADLASKDPFVFKKPIQHVAVIGAGPAGLASARRLRDMGLKVKVFDRNDQVGGIWIYSERPPIKPKIPTSRVTTTIDNSVHEHQKKILEMTPEVKTLLLSKNPPSAIYRDLHNNVATHLSELPDFPYPKGTPAYVLHSVILDYYQSYAQHFDLLSLCEFNTSVDLVLRQEHGWDVIVSKYDVYTSGMVREQKWRESFDAIVVASGLYHDPYVPDIEGLTAFNKIYPEKVMHSSQFRIPEVFKDKNVLVIGGSVSGVDIVRAIDGIANNVTISIEGPFKSESSVLNVIRSTIPSSVSIKPKIDAFKKEDGTIHFEDGTHLKDIDTVIFCTGYENRVPFLGDLVTEVMGPKYPQNVFHEVFAISDPTLAFVGQPPAFTCPAHFDAQANAVARVWAGRAYLPKDMRGQADAYQPHIPPQALFDADRRRREPFVAWLNRHAEGQEDLPPVENFSEDYEEEGERQISIWVEESTAIFKKIKEKALKNLSI